MHNRMYISAMLIGLTAACSSGDLTIEEDAPGLAARAAVDGQTAMSTALRSVPGGDIEKAVIEEEDGRLVYSFDIEVEGREGIEEVLVDAMTGAVVSVQHEDEGIEEGEEHENEAARDLDEDDEEEEEGEEGHEAAAAISPDGEVVTIVESPELRDRATISDSTARRTALEAVPGGRIVKAELEEEDGKFIYSFDIQVEGQDGIEEVHVDARTGLVVGREHESGS